MRMNKEQQELLDEGYKNYVNKTNEDFIKLNELAVTKKSSQEPKFLGKSSMVVKTGSSIIP